MAIPESSTSLSAGAVASAGLFIASPAHAALADGTVSAYGYTYYNAVCSSTSWPSPTDVPLTDNGALATATNSQTGSVTSKTDLADVSLTRISSAVTASATPITGGPATVSFSGTASASVTPHAATVCDPEVNSVGRADGTIVLPAATWATINGSTTVAGHGAVSFSLYGAEDATRSVDSYLEMSSGTSAASLYLPAGKYRWRSDVYAYADTITPSTTQSGSFTLTLTPGGTASPVVGKGAKYVALGGRNCATNTVAANLTKSVKKAKKVVVKVNGRTAVNLATTKKRKTLKPSARAFAVAPNAPVTVVATITPKKGKKVTVSRSYLACS